MKNAAVLVATMITATSSIATRAATPDHDSLARLQLDHLSILVDVPTMKAFSQLPFMDQFSGYSKPGSLGPVTTAYIFGQRNFIELIQKPSDVSLNVANELALELPQVGGATVIYNAFKDYATSASLADMAYEAPVPEQFDETPNWYTTGNPNFEESGYLDVYGIEWSRAFVASQPIYFPELGDNDVSTERSEIGDYKPDRLLDSLDGVTLALNPKYQTFFAHVAQAMGFTCVSCTAPEGADQLYVGQDGFQYRVVGERADRQTITQIHMKVHGPQLSKKTYTFGTATLQLSADAQGNESATLSF